MRVLLCTNSFENTVNGPAKFANLILEINHSYPNHQIKILTEDITHSYKDVFKVDLNIPWYLNPLSQFLRMFIYHKKAQSISKIYPYDILIYNNSFIGLWSAIASSQPTIGMINDYNNLSITFRNWRNDRFWLKKFVFKQFERLSCKFHKLIITNSDYLTQQVIQVYQVPISKICRLYKSIDLQESLYNTKRNFTDPIHILFVKADFMCGGIDILAAALAILTRYNFQVTVIGPDERFREKILFIFKGQPHIIVNFLSRQSQDVVRKYLQTCDIFCVPSRREALGVANIEALRAGIPVISTNVGGIPEVLDNGSNGWLVSSENVEELSVAIHNCIVNPEKRLIHAMNGVKFTNKFAKTTMFENFIQIIEKCNKLSGIQH